MNDRFQHGHMDADQLSAFMEHALPERERVQTLAHLAVCAECRRVVSLAADAAAEEELFPAPVVAMPVRSPWWKMPVWQWSLPLAAVVALMLVTVHRPKTTGPVSVETAAKATPPLAQAQANSMPPFAQTSTVQSTRTAAKGVPASPRIEPESILTPSMIARDTASEASAVPPPPKLPAPLTSPADIAGGIAGPPGAAITLGAASGAKAVTLAQAAAAPMPAPPPPPPQTSATILTGASVNDLASAPPLEKNRKMAAMTPAAPPVAMIPLRPLPDGLPMVSSVASASQNGRQTLALDSGNHLFLTSDGGAHWETVKAKWGGRAVTVSLVAQEASGVGHASAPMDTAQGYVVAAAPARTAGSSVSGVVVDATGAFIPGTTVTLTNAATKAVVKTTKTDKNGRYTIAAAAGSYLVDAQRSGFTRDQVAITIPEHTASTANMALTVGSESTVVEVISSNADLQTTNATVGDTIDARQIQSLPMRKAKKGAEQPVFALTTDAGERWVSVDGKTWVKR